jgi:portal protein
LNDLSVLYDLALKGDLEKAQLQALVPQRSWFQRVRLGREAAALDRQIEKSFEVIGKLKVHAEEQHSMVNDLMMAIRNQFDTAQGVKEQSGPTFEWLYRSSYHCEPAAAIIETRVQQACEFAQEGQMRHGIATRPGIKIRMTDREAEAGSKDKENINLILRYVLNNGFCPPPDNQKPDSWQRGMEPLMRMIVRDTLTYDWVTIRRWASEENPKKFPCVAYWPEDASCTRKVQPRYIKIVDGVPIYEAWGGKRVTKKGVKTVKLAGQNHQAIVEEFTEEEMATFVRNPRSRIEANGYGFSELERSFNAIGSWIFAREFNSTRFMRDTLPRGFWKLVGQMDQAQVAAFKLQMKQMMTGNENHWRTPVVAMKPGQGSDFGFVPVDLNSRDMEYHQWMFAVALWMHAIFQIHPEETGYQALSPWRPPLSEASPEAKLKSSQDKGLNPLLRAIERWFNWEFVWKLFPDQRYTLEFVGLEDVDMLQHIELYTMMLQSGLITPRMVWAELDQEVPDIWKDHPAMDTPAPFAEGVQLVMSMQQQQNEQQMAQQNEMRTQQQHEQGMDINKVNAAHDMQMRQQAFEEGETNNPTPTGTYQKEQMQKALRIAIDKNPRARRALREEIVKPLRVKIYSLPKSNGVH